MTAKRKKVCVWCGLGAFYIVAIALFVAFYPAEVGRQNGYEIQVSTIPEGGEWWVMCEGDYLLNKATERGEIGRDGKPYAYHYEWEQRDRISGYVRFKIRWPDGEEIVSGRVEMSRKHLTFVRTPEGMAILSDARLEYPDRRQKR